MGMKTLADAFSLRNRIIEMLERADLEEHDDQRRAQLTFVVGGGGFSGVETAGELEEFLRRVRKRYYPKVDPGAGAHGDGRARDRLLPEMPPEMGEYARGRLAKRGYEIRLGTAIKEVRRGRGGDRAR